MPRSPIKLAILLIFLALVLVPLSYYGLDSELAKWKAARAQLQHDNGDTPTAIATMQAAIDQSPRDHWLKLGMSRLLYHDGQGKEALEIAEEVLQLNPNSTEALMRKSECLMFLGRRKEALETIKDYYEKSPRAERISQLNHLAYFRALAKTELDLAKAEIDEVVKTASIYYWPENPPMSLQDQTLLVAAILSRHVGNHEQVIKMLDQRIEVFESSIPIFTGMFLGEFHQKMMESLPVSKELEENVKANAEIVDAEKSFLAYLYTIRALLYQEMGRNKDRDADRAAIEELGLDEKEILSMLPGKWESLSRLYIGAQYLDTRALVSLARRKNMFQARQDMDVAILAMELTVASFDGQIQNTIHNENGKAFSLDVVRRNQAVMLKHRSNLNRAMGRNEESERDLKRIGELGFTNLESLY